MAVIPALQRLTKEDHGASLGYMVRTCIKKTQKQMKIRLRQIKRLKLAVKNKTKQKTFTNYFSF
jgi:hypothetical protein